MTYTLTQHARDAMEKRGMRVGGKNARQTVKLRIDRQADALYLTLDESGVVESEEVSPGIIVH